MAPLTPSIAAKQPLDEWNSCPQQGSGRSTFGRRLDERHLFLMAAKDGRAITEGERTTTPPVCEPCALESVRACPHLREGHAAALVQYTALWGVAGIVHEPTTLAPLLSDDDGLTEVSYDDPLIRWTLAYRTVVTLHRVTTVDLDTLVAQEAAA
ncbi:hypothetical protein [Streptomyces sp. NPDC058280]|uniref:hypothetical protein n=1 Tax=Streptomyces sp. NPDC058280 TaxID=3346419 RepID=UPI0036E5DFC9